MEENKPAEPIDFLKYYVEPHKKKSREVKEKDLKRVIDDAHIMYNLCYTQRGIYPGGFAVAHPQITKKDPLRFFVTKDKQVIINPKIIRHTQVTVDSVEGCLSYPLLPMRTVQRWNKCEVEYHTLTPEGEISDRLTINLSGKDSKIYQHELDHLDGKYIYEQ